MNRRDFLRAAAAPPVQARGLSPLVVPVQRVMDVRAKCTREELRRFWWSIWPQAVRDFSRCAIELRTTDRTGEIRLSPAGRPLFRGLERRVINLVLTGVIPMHWDNGRALPGVTTLFEGYHLCVIALRYAHGHRVPYLSVNTCVHELLHALLQDILVSRPRWFQTLERETRNDWCATRLWLFHEGGIIRESAQAYLKRLQAQN
ncbi:MAG: hypothetical protein ACE15B_14025 [Bryobacteraceae bacterium]